MSYITLEEAKDHCRIDYSDDDHYVEALIDVAEASIVNEITGPWAGVGTVTTVATTALTGDDTTFLKYKVGDSIKVDGESSRVIATITSDTALTVTSAFANTDIGLCFVITPSPLESGVLPKPLKQAMLLLIGHLYNQREPVIIGSSAVKIPHTIDMLIAPYKNWVVK
jgi:hypothetical protein